MDDLGRSEQDDMNQPLTRENLTTASRVMLPVYLIFYSWVGGSYFLTNRDTLDKSPALEYAADVMDMRAWAIMFLLMAVLMLTAMLTGKREVMAFALMLGVVVNGIWFVVIIAASVAAPASPSAAAWPFLAGAASYASYKSVSKGETGRRR